MKQRKKTLFVAMPIDPDLDDTLDAIKTVANELGMVAIRIDQQESNEKISDRIIQEINSADYIVADLTNSKPNVFFEAGYALGIKKPLTFIAKSGTKLEFDIQDYPVILFPKLTSLKTSLKKRIAHVQNSKPASTPSRSTQKGTKSRKGDTLPDKAAILTQWFDNQLLPRVVRFSDLDAELDFKPGDAKKLVEVALRHSQDFMLHTLNPNTFKFVVRPRQYRQFPVF